MRTERRADRARRLRDLLRRSLVTAPQGSLLPSEIELGLRFGATRNEVREALSLLRDEGMVERLQGAGTFVVSHTARHRFDRLQHFEDGVDGGRDRVQNQVLACAPMSAPSVVADALEVAPGTPVVLLERLTRIDGEPVMLSTGYLPGDVAQALEHHPLEGQVYRLFEALGYDLDRADMEIGAVVADRAVAAALRVEPGVALLRLERVIRVRSGRPIEYGVSLLRGDRMAMVSSLLRHPGGHDG